MSWVEITENLSLRCVKSEKSDKPYTYESKDNDGEILVISHNKYSPTELGGGDLHNFLKKTAEESAKQKLIDKLGDSKFINDSLLTDETNSEFLKIKNLLEKKMEYESQQSIQEEKQYEKKMQEKYDSLNASFKAYCEEYQLTPLELIIATSHCLGVGNPREMINAFFGFFQTYTGIKATNVIAVGTRASGKSFMVDNALSMIPPEKVHLGIDSVAHFFRHYDKKDVTGHIFFMGDLGGEFDDNDTLKIRDKLKTLTTDGFVKRGIVDKETHEEEEQWVEGYPCLSYTTANEDIINDQEKSRSIVLTPQVLDSEKLMIYNSLQDAKGVYYSSLNRVNHIAHSVQGFVYNYDVEDYDFFNPYMFTIEKNLKNNIDFTRKIQEYEAVLKIVTCLHKPFSLKHNIYLDESFEEKETRIIIATKQDNINALNIFMSSNLLPDEIKFANGLIKEYMPPKVPVLDSDDYDKAVKEWIMEDVLAGEDKAYDQFAYNGKIDEEHDLLSDCFFSVETLKKKHRNKVWFRKSGAKQASNRLIALYNEGILIKVGKSTHGNMNVYALNKGMDKPVEEVIPEFEKEDLDKALDLFKKIYPENYDELMEFIKTDEAKDKSLFETVKPIIPNLPFLDGVYDGL